MLVTVRASNSEQMRKELGGRALTFKRVCFISFLLDAVSPTHDQTPWHGCGTGANDTRRKYPSPFGRQL